MRRREFIAGFVTLSIGLPLAASAQQQSLPVVAFIGPLSPEASARYLAAFRAGLGELGYVEGRNVGISYHWLTPNNYDLLPSIMADLVQSRVAVIASP
jgi:putative ABC transport system substrate-binding protein